MSNILCKRRMLPHKYTGQESVQHSNGMIEKSGYKALVLGGATVTFDTPFPNGIDSVVIIEKPYDIAYQVNVGILSISVSNIVVGQAGTDFDGFYWMAKGW